MRQTHHLPVQFVDKIDSHLKLSGLNSEEIQISILADDLIRVRLYPDGVPRLNRTWLVGEPTFEGHNRDDLSMFTCSSFDYEVDRDAIQVKTKVLDFMVSLADFRITWGNFAADTSSRAYAYDQGGQSVFHYMVQRSDEHYFGFGEKAGILDKRGQRMTMKNIDAIGYNAETSDPLYKHYPFYITFIPEQQIAYGLFYDNLATTVFDMGREIDGYHGAYRMYQALAGDLDYYFIYGPSIPEVIEKFTALTGRIALPPKWSLGYLGSTMTYTEAPDAQTQLSQFVDLCEQHNISCDMFHLSSGYTTGEEDGKRYVFTWNKQKLPEPKQMVEHFQQSGINLCANIKPYLLTTHPKYEQIKEIAIQAADADEPEFATLWSGAVGEVNEGVYLDFTNPDAIVWWQNQVRENLLEYGIVSTWNDNNEFQLWDDAARCNGFGNEIELGLVRPIQTLLMVRSSYLAQQEFAPETRPFVLSRAGCPGLQRYAQTWTGDNRTSWHTLKYNIPMGLNLGLSGLANIGHDVGGFAGEKPSAELLVRWVQNGIFHPRFTMHSFNDDGSVNEPWMYPEVLDLVREAFELRYQLIPYIYSLFHESHLTGHPIIRPLVYEFPTDPNCITSSFDFMLGSALLVASVYQEGATSREVYLPQGADWIDFFTGDYYKGGQMISLDTPLHRIPLLVRAGSIIPLAKLMKHIGAEPDNYRELRIFPAKGISSHQFVLYEDDGITQDGAITTLDLTMQTTDSEIAVNAKLDGDFDLSYTTMNIVLPPYETRQLKTPMITL